MCNRAVEKRVLSLASGATLKQNLQFALGITVLVTGLGFCAYPVHAQRGARAFSVSSPPQTRAVSSQASAPHAPSLVAVRNRQPLQSSSSQTNPILATGSKFPPVNRRRPAAPVPPVRTTGYYWIFDGGTYWVPADSEQTVEQATVDQTTADQMGGGQSVDSDQNQSLRTGAGIEQVPGPDSQSSAENSYSSQGEAEKESSPVLDEGEFTLVLNDGRQIEAVAFTHANDSIVYITTAGSRYTIAANELDAESTVRVNQERGTPLQSPL
jgi:hypothetical protein